jgi:hypothetical protein
VVHALNHAVAAGDTNAEKRIKEFVTAMLADTSISEDDRVGVLMFSGNTAFSKKVGMRLFTEGMSKLDAEFESNLRFAFMPWFNLGPACPLPHYPVHLVHPV